MANDGVRQYISVERVSWKAILYCESVNLMAGHNAVRVSIKGVVDFYLDDGLHGKEDHVFLDSEIDRRPLFGPPKYDVGRWSEDDSNIYLKWLELNPAKKIK